MTAPIDYNAVLADLEAKRAQIDSAIAVIRALIGGGITDTPSIAADDGASPGTIASTAFRPTPTLTGIQSDTFFRLSTSQAIRKYLGMVKRPQTPKAIADALHSGGQVHAADPQRAYNNVFTALGRSPEDFVKTRNGEWGLAEWYSNKPKGEDTA
jgi:hypothetical protein